MSMIVMNTSSACESHKQIGDCETRKRKQCDTEATIRSSKKKKQLEPSKAYGLRVNPSKFVTFQIVGSTKQTRGKLSSFVQ